MNQQTNEDKIEGVKDRMIKAGHAGNIVSYCEKLEQENAQLKAEVEKWKKETRIEGKGKSQAQALIQWHQERGIKLKAEVEELKKNWRDDVKLSDNAKSQMWIEFEREHEKLRELLKEAIEKDLIYGHLMGGYNWIRKAKAVLGE